MGYPIFFVTLLCICMHFFLFSFKQYTVKCFSVLCTPNKVDSLYYNAVYKDKGEAKEGTREVCKFRLPMILLKARKRWKADLFTVFRQKYKLKRKDSVSQ